MSACKWQSSSSRIYKKNSHYFCLLFVEFSAFFNLEIHIWQLNDCNIRSNKTNHNAHIKLTSHEAAISYDRFVLFQRVFQMFYAYVYVFLAWSFVFIPKKCLFKKKSWFKQGRSSEPLFVFLSIETLNRMQSFDAQKICLSTCYQHSLKP